MLTAQRRVRTTERRYSMNNEQKNEYIKPGMTVFEIAYENKLLVDSPENDEEEDSEMDFED